MTNKELDQILQQALTPEVDEQDIQMNWNKEKTYMKRKNILKPMIAAAACVAVIVVCGVSHLPKDTTVKEVVTGDVDLRESVANYFTVKVKAAEIKELQKGKEQPIVYESGYTGSAWGADPKTKVVSYGIGAPLFCEGKGIKTVTYEINKGAFEIIEPKKNPYVLEGVEYEGEIEGGGSGPNDCKNYVSKYYTSFTVAADKQKMEDVYVNIGGETKVSSKMYKKMWGANVTREDTKSVMDKVLEDVVITCTVTYKDGSTESVDVSVGNKIMTYVEAGVDVPESPKANCEAIFTTFTMK